MKRDNTRLSELAKSKANEVGRDWVKNSDYYDNADSWVYVFWNDDSDFRQMFNQLDTRIIVELACGRGRHSWQMRDWPNRKILVDMVPDNVDYCRRRFRGYSDVTFIANNGVDLSDIGTETVSAVFSFDSMVHFDHTVVYNYLFEIYRVLEFGGKTLLHHSNNSGNPGGDYRHNPHWRNFMPPGLFFDYARKTGFEVLSQRIIPWGDVQYIERISLLRKPVQLTTS
jgi:ubiquinone/menaquinone biosynthesis C-methylase UbiE